MARKKEEIKKAKENIIEIDCAEELRTSMLEFSFESIDRSIPDVRDGLKPVHRRILYTMHTEGNTADKPYKKSVKSVGSTLGRFHPHGDCLRGNTRVLLLDGSIKTIKELYDLKSSVWALGLNKNGNVVPVLAEKFRIGQKTKKLYHVKFSNGYEIVTTNQHQFNTIDNNWVKAQDLKKGDIIEFVSVKKINNKKPRGHKIYGSRLVNTMLNYQIARFINPNIKGLTYMDYSVIHIDDNPLNSKPDNLRIVDTEDNEYEVEFNRYIKSMREKGYDDWSESIMKIYKSNVEFEKAYKILPKKEPITITTELKKLISKTCFKNLIKNKIAIVENVEIEELENEENMYDFTVEGFENMFVSANEKDTLFVNVHNSSVYDAMVRLSQDFKMNLPLIDVHGNGGSIDGDPAAAMRYTEARLSKPTEYLLQDLEKGVVPFIDNFDGEEQEPVILPAKFPQLLVNGTQGLAVGMASDIPSHNLGEVIDTYNAYLDNKNITVRELVDILHGPDYCTGGIIINQKDLLELYETGHGNVTIRAKTHIEKGDAGRTNIIVDEIPVTMSGSKQLMISKIISMVIAKTFPEIHSIQDESSKDGIRICIEVKKGYDVNNVLNKLFSKTQLQTNENYNFLVTFNKKPKIINLKEYFEYYFEFNKSCVISKYKYLLQKIYERREIVDGLIDAINYLDIIVEIARYHKTKQDMMNCLMLGNVENIYFKTQKYKKIAEKFHFTERQALAIRNIRLDQLSNLELEKLIDEQTTLNKKEVQYLNIIKSEKSIIKEIKKDLKEIKNLYSVSRKTELVNLQTTKFVEEKQIENVIILIDRFNYIKSISDTTLNRANDKLKSHKYIVPCTSDDKIGIFTNKGNLYQIKISDIPGGKLSDKGIPIENLSELTTDEYILDVLSMDSIKSKKILFHTSLGFVKIVDGSEFISIKRTIKATKLDENDELCYIGDIDKKIDILCETEKGYRLKYSIDEISELKKNSRGIKSIEMLSSDKIKNILLIDDEMYLKDESLNKIPLKKRARKGSKI